MKKLHILGIVGFLCMIFSLSVIPPILVAVWYDDGEAIHFMLSFLMIHITGLFLWLPARGAMQNFRRRDGFIIVTLFWVVLSLLSAIPFAIGPHLSFVDAFFEAVSGFTTTGATVIVGLDSMAPSILYYRGQLQWLGGMGLIVLAVAIMPMLGIGGMQLYKAEAPGPMKEDKLTPRLAETARALWLLYVGLTVACMLGFWAAGMSAFDAITHAYATVSTGGFSTHDASLGYFNSPLIDIIAVVFMLSGGINFAVHYRVVVGMSLRPYWRDVEVRTFLVLIVAAIAVIAAVLWLMKQYGTLHEALINSLFEVVSVITSTGFGTADFSTWPSFLPVMLIFMSFIGGCGGSTAGGMKVSRVMLLLKQGGQEINYLIHPYATRPLRIGAQVLAPRISQAIWGFFSVYVVVFVLLTLMMMAAGLDQVSAFSAIATCMNNLGPGLGEVAVTFAGVSDSAKVIGILAMLLGRLEIFTMLVILA
ncbi:MAG: TrkH family potassium uptake protein, partial [Chromatiaceae bacterium]|nr:TrkH family potassium uptake protein [Chromatiaceae bacterium]